MRAAVALAAAGLGLALAAPPAAATPSEDLSRGEAEYYQGQYEQAVKTLEPLLKPRPRLTDEGELKKAHLLLARSYFFLDRRQDAELQIVALLYVDPAYQVDPVLEIKEFYSTFERIRSELKLKLEEIERQRRLEEAERRKPRTMLIVERHYHDRAAWQRWVPFGYAQFRHRPRWLAWTISGTQAVGAGVSMYAFGAQAIQYGVINPTYPSDRDEQRYILELQWAQFIGAGVFFAGYAWNVVDAYRHRPPAYTETRREVPVPPGASPGAARGASPGAPPGASRGAPAPAARSRTVLTPFFGPGGSGLSVTWEF